MTAILAPRGFTIFTGYSRRRADSSTNCHRNRDGTRPLSLPRLCGLLQAREPIEHDRDLGSRRNGLLERFPQEETLPVSADAEPRAAQCEHAEKFIVLADFDGGPCANIRRGQLSLRQHIYHFLAAFRP